MDNLSVKINFTVLKTEDPTIIMVGDLSNWGVAKNQPSYIKLLPPSSTNWITTTFAKERLNVFTSVNLGLSCFVEGCDDQVLEDLDDGVWEICVASSFKDLDKHRYFLKDDILRNEMDELYIKGALDYNPSSDIIKALEKAEFFLAVAHAAIKKGDHSKAKKAYLEAKKEVDKYKNCKDCI